MKKKLQITIALLLNISVALSLEASPLPSSLIEDWYAKDGIDLTTNETDPSWKKFEKLRITIKDIEPNDPNETFRRITLLKKFQFEKSFLKNLNEDISILIPFITNIYDVYFNGQKIASGGKLDGTKVLKYGMVRGLVVILPQNTIKEENTLRFVVQGGYKEEVGLWGKEGDNTFELDYYKNNIQKASDRVTLMLLFMYMFVGLYHLLLYAKRPKEKYNLYFGLFSVLISVYNYTRSNAVFEWGLDPFKVIVRVEYIFLFFIPALAILFFENFFFEKKASLYSRIYLGFVSILGLLMLFVPRWVTTQILLIWQLSALSVLGYLGYVMTKAVKLKNKDAFRLLIGFSILVITALWDLLGAIPVGGLRNLGLMRYGFFTFIMGIAVVLANKFLRVHNQVEELNAHLERKVEERTAELQKTLTEVKELKVQQDGDYFLTSLLIKPLGVNRSKGDFVHIDFFVRQKKHFEFKNKDTEIGGDLCIAHSIQLKGKDYTVFLNGDAMGKSIQGAGGALVLGVVLKSIIVRTQMDPISQDKFPEQWLKHAFIELQDVFVSFDGSMLVSMVIGMVEDFTGFMYYINAEHPWSVLYRDGKASFIDNDLSLHKIGVMGLDGDLSIKTVQLLPQDVVIIGSDGRDDIILGIDEDGNRIINEDENQFLHHVENGEGTLEKIALSVQNAGELSDDFTMLRIGYKENEEYADESSLPEKFWEEFENGKKELRSGNLPIAMEFFEKAYSIHSKNLDLIKEMGKLSLKQKDYARASSLCDIYTFLNPSDNEFIYLASFANKMNKDYVLSADYGERLKLRDPKNTKNLINLSDTYRLLGNIERARKILAKAIFLDPENPNALKLDKMLKDFVPSPEVIE
ncbi:MAG: SpoIIE family protein phosphatase [Leptospiraceae bacterium]|nr:SpoIIE family protein phosphatase [Leptospiraceae bacterium]MCK6380790.1 SpoIIE family protein phosphatase [Leptospiraceae bacterium]NUM40493.1 SpoIIE family protein phosphatase [Leptospiraceae bacterium]